MSGGHASTFCRQCGARFANRKAADAHRAGEWGSAAFPRRCRTDAEMVAGGMWQSQRGVWHGELTESGVPVPANAWQGRGSGVGRGDAA